MRQNPGEFPDPKCCIHDKFEDCMVQQFQCFQNVSSNCTDQLRSVASLSLRAMLLSMHLSLLSVVTFFSTFTWLYAPLIRARLKMAKFLQCFEGTTISEGHCDADALK